MPERNPFFSCEVFPKQHCDESHSTVGIKFEFSWFHAFMWQRLYLRCTRRHKSLFQITLQDSPFTKCVCTAWYSPICVKFISKSKKETNNIHHSKNKLADYATKKSMREERSPHLNSPTQQRQQSNNLRQDIQISVKSWEKRIVAGPIVRRKC